MGQEKDSPIPMIFDRAGIREVDRIAIETHGIPGLVLMENAATAACDVALGMIDATAAGARIVITCGTGNNGGDGYAMARILHEAGHSVSLLASGAPRANSDAATNAERASQLGLEPVRDVGVLANASLIIDALLGTGLDRPVNDTARVLIEAMNQATAPILSIDLPSGLDSDTGVPLGTAVHATATATFVGWKAGFLVPAAAAFTGVLHVMDIGIPDELARSLCLQEPG